MDAPGLHAINTFFLYYNITMKLIQPINWFFYGYLDINFTVILVFLCRINNCNLLAKYLNCFQLAVSFNSK